MLLRYRGGQGMLAWAFHRISGIALWAFIILHVVDIYLVGGNPQAYNDILAIYASAPGRLAEVLLGAALLYHALNGLRILIMDLWPTMTRYQRALWYAAWVLFVVVFVPGAWIILAPVLRPALGL
jgi:succinate dehydrogenase / fumarate reductase cytochrome b subunit